MENNKNGFVRYTDAKQMLNDLGSQTENIDIYNLVLDMLDHLESGGDIVFQGNPKKQTKKKKMMNNENNK